MIQGVFDDRGKYIYLEKEELDVVEKAFIKKGKFSR